MGSILSATRARQFQYEDGSIIKSLHSISLTDITFHNTTSVAANVYWLNYHGEKVLYAVLPPNEKMLFSTFLTHPWTFEAVGDSEDVLVVNDKRVCFPLYRGQVEQITIAKAAQWTMQRHKEFAEWDPDFQAYSQALLLCHYAAWKPESNLLVQNPKKHWASIKASRTPAEDGGAAASQGRQSWPLPAGRARVVPRRPLHVGTMAVKLRSAAGGASKSPRTADRQSNIGSVPLDIILAVIKLMAPKMPDLTPVPLSDLLDIVLPA